MVKSITKEPPTSNEFESFQDLTKKLLSVPPKELREAKSKSKYNTKRGPRKARPARKSNARPKTK